LGIRDTFKGIKWANSNKEQW